VGLLGLSKDPRIDEVFIQRARNTSSSYRWVSAILRKGRAGESRLIRPISGKLGHYGKRDASSASFLSQKVLETKTIQALSRFVGAGSAAAASFS